MITVIYFIWILDLEAIKDADLMQEYDELMEKWRFIINYLLPF